MRLAPPRRRPPPAPPQNLLDKALAYIAPRVAQRRMQARLQLALSGGYTGARIDRAAMASWQTQAGSPQTDVIVDLPMLRERSADLERNAPVAAAVINTTVTHAVGTGLSMHPQIDADFLGLESEAADAWQQNTRRRFRVWAESEDCSLDRTLNFYGLQAQWLRGALSRGDIFVLTPRVGRAGQAPRLALQTIEADRVCNPLGKRDTDTLTDGIECSADTGEAIAYFVANRHPADMLGSRTWQRVAARGSATGRKNVLHLFVPLRPGLRRGVPILAPVIEPLKQLARYTEAELAGAVAASLFPLFATMDPAAFGDLFSDEQDRATILDSARQWSGEIESGKVVNLLPGEKVESPSLGRPNPEFDPFWQSCVRQVGMAVGIPYEVLVMLYSSSYTAARGSLLMAWRTFMGRRDWLGCGACQSVYEIWLAEEVAEGRIAAPGFFADPVVRHAWCGAQWIGDGPGSIDPGKEVAAAKARVELETSTLQAESILHDGVDWETKHRQRVKEIELQREDGTLAEPTQPVGAQPQDDPAAEDKPPPAQPNKRKPPRGSGGSGYGAGAGG